MLSNEIPSESKERLEVTRKGDAKSTAFYRQSPQSELRELA